MSAPGEGGRRGEGEELGEPPPAVSRSELLPPMSLWWLSPPPPPPPPPWVRVERGVAWHPGCRRDASARAPLTWSPTRPVRQRWVREGAAWTSGDGKKAEEVKKSTQWVMVVILRVAIHRCSLTHVSQA
jgi:hypothetical protein